MHRDPRMRPDLGRKMIAFRASIAQRRAAAFVIATVGAIGFVPLFGGPGYESALASGFFVPTAASMATAWDTSASPPARPIDCVGRGLKSGLVLSALAMATTLLHAMRVGMCDLVGGLLLFVLTAGVGALMGGVFGAAVGELARGSRKRRLLCVLGASTGPLAGTAISVARFYGSPMVFAFDPFFGFFSGALYDTIVDVRPELWSYRAGSLATLAGVALVASALTRNPRGAVAWPSVDQDAKPLWRLGIGAVLLAASVAAAAAGPALGHWQTASTIAAALGARASGPRCDVVYPDSLSAKQGNLLVRDCEEEIASAEARLETRLTGRLTAYFFRDALEKRRLMGAAETSMAKPWRHEVYVQLAAYPHPVLGHEVAHVIAGSFARGPFRVGGSASGWWPNPGLIEGIAVAASPDDDELSGAQWARAMLDLEILPSGRTLFSLGFLGDNAAKSYTVAGAFVTWVGQRWGLSVVHRWYAGASLEELTGTSWTTIDAQFRDALRGLEMPPGAAAYAQARFARPGVWMRHCPHVVDAFDRQGDSCRNDHRIVRAREEYQSALARDAFDWHARFEVSRMDLRYGDSSLGRAELERLVADESAPRTVRDRADEALADDDSRAGSPGECPRALSRACRPGARRGLREDARSQGHRSGRPECASPRHFDAHRRSRSRGRFLGRGARTREMGRRIDRGQSEFTRAVSRGKEPRAPRRIREGSGVARPGDCCGRPYATDRARSATPTGRVRVRDGRRTWSREAEGASHGADVRVCRGSGTTGLGVATDRSMQVTGDGGWGRGWGRGRGRARIRLPALAWVHISRRRSKRMVFRRNNRVPRTGRVRA